MIRAETIAEEQAWGDSSTEAAAAPVEQPGPVTVEHVADFGRRYPGELAMFYTRLEVRETVADLALRVSIPPGLTVSGYQNLSSQNGTTPYTEVTAEMSYLVWLLEGDLPVGAVYEYRTETRVGPAEWDITLASQATATARDQSRLAEETAVIVVSAKSSYLKHLPSIYERDDLLNHFLMFFESFWAPIEEQIEKIHYYFDPRITPAKLLPWLASWLDLALDERWPEARRRQLVRWAIALHRSRGTKWGLLKYLEIYSGQQAEIVEHRAKNFVLNSETRLGPGVALGRRNTPHTFTITLRLPPLEVEDKQEQARLEKIRRRTIESIIEMQKPAHTVYTLTLEPLSSQAAEADAAAEAKARQRQKEGDQIAVQAAIWFKLDDPTPGQTESQAADQKAKSSKRRGKRS
jgi:phage tail-like protein